MSTSGGARTAVDPDEGAATDAALTGADTRKVGEWRAFVLAHGGTGTAVINYVGRVGARIVVVAADGAFGDAVVAGVHAGAAVCRRAGIPVADEWDRELSAAVRPSAQDRRRMAGTGR